MGKQIAITRAGATDETFAYYDSAAHSYGWPAPNGTLSANDDVYLKDRFAIETFIATFASGRVLDLGCGDGRNVQLYRAGSTWIGLIDQSEQMLSRAISLAGTMIPKESIYHEQAILPGWVPSPQLSVESVLISFLLSHLSDNEIHRVIALAIELVKDGGNVLLVDALWHPEVDISTPNELKNVRRNALGGRSYSIKKRYFSPDWLSDFLSNDHSERPLNLKKEYTGQYFFGWRIHFGN